MASGPEKINDVLLEFFNNPSNIPKKKIEAYTFRKTISEFTDKLN